MLAISSRPADRRPARAGIVVDVAVALFCAVMLLAMMANPGEETIPYHLLFLCVTIAYGFRVWPLRPTMVVLSAITLATGWVMFSHYRDGAIDEPELSEIGLMPALVAAMVWHARRRAAAQWEVQRMADERTLLVERLRDFFRDASHAIRTPVTIARGHMELVQDAVTDAETREDVEVALRQLARMSRLSERLLALAKLDSGIPLNPRVVDVREFVEELGHSWTTAVDRRWLVECNGESSLLVDPDVLGLAVDALIENAVHHTRPGEGVELRSRISRAGWEITVIDDGPGVVPADLDLVFERFWHTKPPNGPMGSGLGLAMVAATAKACGGVARVANVPGRGARFDIELPVPAAL